MLREDPHLFLARQSTKKKKRGYEKSIAGKKKGRDLTLYIHRGGQGDLEKRKKVTRKRKRKGNARLPFTKRVPARPIQKHYVRKGGGKINHHQHLGGGKKKKEGKKAVSINFY